MRPVAPASALAVLVFLAACGEPAAEGEAGAEDKPEAAIPVEVSTPTRGDIYSTYYGTAPIEAFAEATVVAKVRGEVRAILAEEGDEVREGQVLARLDGDRLRLELEQAEANLNKLKRDYERNVDLKAKGLLSAGDFDRIQYEMEALEATYNLAKLELSYTEIQAPIDGVVSERMVKVGNTIDVNAPVFRVTSLEPLVAYLHVPEREYRRIGKGMPATIEVDALRETRFEAEIARISPVVDPDTGTFKITVEVTDPSRRLKPGMFARIGIVSDLHADALQVPRAAIVEDGDEQSVYVVEEGKAAKRTVTTGFVSGGRVEITGGLSGDERVVTVGQTGLRDGSRVEVINPEAEQSGSLAANPVGPADDES